MNKFINKINDKLVDNDLIGNYLTKKYKNVLVTPIGGLITYNFSKDKINYTISTIQGSLTVEVNGDNVSSMFKYMQQIESEKQLQGILDDIIDCSNRSSKLKSDLDKLNKDNQYFIFLGK